MGLPETGECVDLALPNCNVGIHLRHGLADVDLDCDEAREVAHVCLPATPFTFGRLSTPASHRLYRSHVAQTRRFQDPVTDKMILEVRTAGPDNGGVQSLAFGTHPNGERVMLDAVGSPAEVTPEELLKAAGLCACTALLARHFRPGDRHETGLAICGWLLRLNLDPAQIQKIVKGIALACANPEPETFSRLQSQLVLTLEKLAAGEPALGRSRLIDDGHLDRKVVEKVEQWLGITTGFNSAEVERRFRFVTDDEDLAVPSPPANSYLGNGVISQGGLVLSAGPMNSAKTLYWMTAAYHLAMGRDFQGLEVPRPLRVLYLEGEANRAVFANRRRQIRAGLAIDDAVPNLLFLARDCSMPKIGNELRQLVEATRAEVVFLDTIGYFHTADENLNSDVKMKVIQPLRDMARSLDWQPAFVMVHHFVKKTEGMSGAARSRGASALSDDSSTVITFTPKGDNTTILLTFEKIKDGPPLPPRTLSVDYAAARVEMLHGSCAARAAEPRLAVVASLTPADVAIQSKDLMLKVQVELGVKDTVAKQLINLAVKAGMIVRESRGKYIRLVEQPLVASSPMVN